MQPLLYLCVRGIITWFLYKERRFRTFSASTGAVLSCGVAHSWAVSYALVAALVLHAVRLSNKSWNAQLPWFLRVAEQLTFVCGIVWWFGGVLLTIIRSLRIDQEGMGLPLDQKESIIPRLMAISQSRRNKDFIALAHRLSFGCIFLCILALCLGIFSLGTSVSSSAELAAALVALCFGVPHAALAVQNLGWAGGSEVAFRAAASEAAMLAPQFTVIIACADAAGPASWWQAVLRLASSLLFTAALVMVARMPPRLRPPSVWEMLESVALDVIAFAMITLYMPHVLNDGMMLVMLGVVVLCILCINFRETRAVIVEFFEPIVPLLATEVSEPPPAHLREALRRSAHGMFVINSLLMLRQAMQHHVTQSQPREIDDQWKPPEAESWDYRPETELDRAEDSDYFREYAGSESSMMPSQGDLMWVDAWPITLAMRWRSEGDLQAAFEALRQEIEVFFEGVHEKLNRLQSAVVVQEIHRGKHRDAEVKQQDQAAELCEELGDPLISVPVEVAELDVSTDRPPPILVEYRKNRTDQETLMQENVFRRYGGLMDAIKEKELRFHGWWMELSTSSVGDETLNRTSTDKPMSSPSFACKDGQITVKVLNFVIHPGGAFRVSWDILGGFLLLVDAILVPLSIAWNFDIHSLIPWSPREGGLREVSIQETSGVLLAISFWSGIVYWGLDIPLNFCTAVYFEGNLVSEKGIIACFYLRRWLLPDVGLTACLY
eukprot:s895_g13.t1